MTFKLSEAFKEEQDYRKIKGKPPICFTIPKKKIIKKKVKVLISSIQKNTKPKKLTEKEKLEYLVTSFNKYVKAYHNHQMGTFKKEDFRMIYLELYLEYFKSPHSFKTFNSDLLDEFSDILF